MSKQDQWTSKLGFILAAAGSAIGLGAIWKLPYMTGENGGGVFFLLFIIFTLLIGAPILIAEFTIGRNAQKDAISAYKHIAPGKPWALIGYGGVVASIILLSFFSVVGGWIISYLARSFTGSLSNLTQEEYGNFFNTIISNPYETVIAQLLFMVFTIWVVQGGVSKGIEKANKYMMPSLFILFIILLIRSLTLDGAMEGVKFFLKPDFSALTGETILLALGQSFFALSVGVSVMVTYASYLSKKEDITKSAFSVVGLNIFISLLAGLVIFPAVFALGFSPSSGPGLVFVVLPAVFNEMALGGIFMFIFFILLLFATLTTAFSILEIVVAAMIKGDSAKRKKASWIAGITVFLIGIPSALSFGVLSDVKIFNLSIFDFADYLTSNIALPVGSLFISLFIGYQMKRIEVQKEFETGADPGRSLFKLWHFLIRYIVPIMIILVFLKSTNLI
ncbi:MULTISPECIES: sodium-dependent transporter [Bacillaceae]|uniref:sodium-dependent transporter n=1 Tax=Bacillaceae TaxID=186817 RepID=UPI000660C52E|nr:MULTISPECIES: sodium-dependent transporter [Bacillaceae]MCF7624948.1 sodium-dependent transporter [Peribacillus frigoritolerans]MEA3574165.1 sodium-dependent transporter [Peribacillus frigoritolerans]PRA88511.1 sodium-dependent transporter [Peribacillus simplex]